MTEMKEQAVNLIRRIPDKDMTYVLSILKNVDAIAVQESSQEKRMEKFFSAAGKIHIDADAIDRLRSESMI